MTAVLQTFQQWGSRITSVRQLSADQAGQAFAKTIERYGILERYYWNEQYEIVNGLVQSLKARDGLYRNIRPIRNPLRRAVDWYPGHLFPGAMTSDGQALPDGTASCMGFASDTDDAIRLAMTQAFLWANWTAERWAVGRGLAMLGDQFAEIEVDYDRAKVYPRWHHPGYVTGIEWNGTGDIIQYRLEIPQFDEDTKRSYLWGKVVDKETITTLKNGKPFGFNDQPATIENPWGFVSAAWCQFRNAGGQHGAALVDGVRPKIDELNSEVSAIGDYIMKFARQPVIVKTDASMKDILAAQTVGGSTADRDNPQGGRQESTIWKFPVDATIDRPLQNLGLAEALPHIQDLAREIEADLPEATLDDKIRELNAPPSGRALAMMFGSAEKRLAESQGNADAMVLKLGQMAVSIGGELANSGAWGPRGALTEQQQRFLPFSLASWSRGDLDNVTIVPRPLFAETPAERVAFAISVEGLRTPSGRRLAGIDEQTSAALDAELAGVAQAGADALGRAFNAGGNP